ncbi:phospholipase A2 inhibitor and Ly6/PLAUR domain-containing protein-like [Lithobates pipiens]
MKFLGLLLVICSLASTGFCILCKSCVHQLGFPCDGISLPCSSDEVCISFYTVITTETIISMEYELSCRPRSYCNMNGSMSTSKDNRLRTGTSCCYTDNCIPPFPTLPPVNSRKNRLMCRSSHMVSNTVECTGNETKCGQLDVTVTGAMILNYTVRGCATRSFCDIYENQMYTIQGINFDTKMFCNDGAVVLHVGILGSAVTILLTKLLFFYSF